MDLSWYCRVGPGPADSSSVASVDGKNPDIRDFLFFNENVTKRGNGNEDRALKSLGSLYRETLEL